MFGTTLIPAVTLGAVVQNPASGPESPGLVRKKLKLLVRELKLW